MASVEGGRGAECKKIPSSSFSRVAFDPPSVGLVAGEVPSAGQRLSAPTMRLLNTRKLELIDVRGDDIPPTPSSRTHGTVTLQEMRRMESKMPQVFNKQKQTIADKKGYAKIKNTAVCSFLGGYANYPAVPELEQGLWSCQI